MHRCSRCVFMMATVVAILLLPLANNLYAQGITGGRPGNYLSWWKLTIIAVVFVFWVRTTDWINRDAMKISKKTNMTQEFWNPMVVFSFLIGFLCVISIPFFFAGLPIYLLTAWLPLTLYFFQRRSKIKQDASIKHSLTLKPGEAPPAEVLAQDEGIEMDFTAAGDDKNDKQGNLIRARSSAAFTEMKEFLNETQFKRAEQVLLDYTRDSVNCRLYVDGAWHALQPMDRETGDAVLESLKNMAGLNAQERRAKQSGKFGIKSDLGKAEIQITSQGVPTGERVQLRYFRKVKGGLNLSQLGMFPDMLEKLKTSLDTAGLSIISAPPTHGLTSSWQGALLSSDRLTRDCLAFVTKDETETVIENFAIRNYESAAKQAEALRAILLTQPDMVVIPKFESKETVDMMSLHATKHERAFATRVSAKSAAEALLRVYAQAGDRDLFLEALKHVTCQRLIRRLCTACRVEVRVQPNIIQKLGGDPRTQGTIFNPWQLPPPEQRVDENGREIEFPPCETCGGIGYIGRIAVFEMLTLDDQLRKFIKKNPKVTAIEQAATKLGKTSLANQTYKLVLLGVTSLAEAQQMLKQK